MYCRLVKRVVPTDDTQETCTLLVCLRTELRYLQELGTVLEASVLLTVCYDILCNHLGDTGYILKEGCGSGIQIHTYFIYTILNDAVQGVAELLLVHVMLVLSDTDGLRINLHELCQRVLQTTCDRCRTTLSHIKVRELFRCQLTCRVHGSTCFIYDYVLYRSVQLMQELYDYLLRLTGRGTVTNGNQSNIVLLNQTGQDTLCFIHTELRCGRVNYHGIQYFTGRVNNCQLTAGTECGVPAEYGLSHDGRLHQKLVQVLTEHLNRTVLCLLGQVVTDFTLNCRCNQTLIAVSDSSTERILCIHIIINDNFLLKVTQNLLYRRGNLDTEELFILATVQRQHTMSRNLLNLLFEFVIHLVYGLFLRILRRGRNRSKLCCYLTDIASVLCVIGNYFGDDVHRTRNCLLCCLDILLRINVIGSLFLQRLVRLLRKNQVCERLQAFFHCNCCSGSSLRTVRTV